MRYDNINAIAHMNKMGGTVSDACNKIPSTIWDLYIEKRVWMSAEYILGSENITRADLMSWSLNDNIE